MSPQRWPLFRGSTLIIMVPMHFSLTLYGCTILLLLLLLLLPHHAPEGGVHWHDQGEGLLGCLLSTHDITMTSPYRLGLTGYLEAWLYSGGSSSSSSSVMVTSKSDVSWSESEAITDKC